MLHENPLLYDAGTSIDLLRYTMNTGVLAQRYSGVSFVTVSVRLKLTSLKASTHLTAS